MDIVVGLIQLRSFQAGFATVDFEIREETTVDRMKTGRQLNFDEYREWTDEIANHKVFIQSFRGGGRVITETGTVPPYQVAVVCVLDSKRFLGIHASCATKEEQEEILAMVRTLEFREAPATKDRE